MRGIMLKRFVLVTCGLVLASLGFGGKPINAQSAGILEGTVTDPSGSAVPSASVEIQNPVSHYSRTTSTDTDGKFRFVNLPLNPYHVVVTATGFAPIATDVDVRS